MNLPTCFLHILENHKDKAAVFSMVCSSIWRARNDIVWNNTSQRAENMVSPAIAYFKQWTEVQKLGKAISPIPVPLTGAVEQWNKPEVGSVKVNCDASIFKNSCLFGVGWIVRDDNGELIYAARSCFAGKPEVHHAEAIGIREALSWVKGELDKDESHSSCNLQQRVLVE